jgi:anti-anti-sigma factor
MMQYVNTILNVQQVRTSSDSIKYGCFSALSHQVLSGIQAQDNAEVTDTIMLNCSGLRSINSHGIRILIKLLIYAQSQQKRLQVFGLSKHNQYIFEITHLSEFIDIVETKTQALGAFHAS